MAKILTIETATSACSVSVGIDGKLAAHKEILIPKSHSTKINLLITQVANDAGIMLSDLDAVSVSKGPGSYTGLRIGVSTAKGLCFALGIPLLAIGTLHALALQAAEFLHKTNPLFLEENEELLYCSMIDARRMEVYAAIYNNHFEEVRGVNADIVDEATYDSFLSQNKVCFYGDGSLKCKALLEANVNAFFIDDLLPSSKQMVGLSESAFKNNEFEDVAYFEPYYLKDFIAGVSKKK